MIMTLLCSNGYHWLQISIEHFWDVVVQEIHKLAPTVWCFHANIDQSLWPKSGPTWYYEGEMSHEQFSCFSCDLFREYPASNPVTTDTVVSVVTTDTVVSVVTGLGGGNFKKYAILFSALNINKKKLLCYRKLKQQDRYSNKAHCFNTTLTKGGKIWKRYLLTADN